MMDVSVNFIEGILLQYRHILNHHTLHFKYITKILVNYTSIKLEIK